MNVVLIGASASGKSTLQTMLINREPCFKKIVTYTTRPPRDGEVNGVDYHYVSVEKFTELADSGFFAEHNSYRGWMYGTPKCTMLCVHMNEVLERDLALKTIWMEDNYFNARSMDVYITKLRKLLKADPEIEINNVHGRGYRLIVPNVPQEEE